MLSQILLWIAVLSVPTRSVLLDVMSSEDIMRYFEVSSIDQVPEYEIVNPYVEDENGRKRRDIESEDEMKEIKLEAFGERYHMRLKENKYLLADGLEIEQLHGNGTVHKAPLGRKRCFYIGQLISHNMSRVAVSTCRGMMGLIAMEKDTLIIRPLRDDHAAEYRRRRTDAENPHIIYKRGINDMMDDKKHFCGLDQEYYSNTSHFRDAVKLSEREKVEHTSSKRSVDCSVKFIEIRLLIDKDMLSYHGSEAIDYTINLMNIAAARFAEPSLGTLVYVHIAKIETLMTDEYTDANGNSLLVTADASDTLDSLADFQFGSYIDDESNPDHWDLAVLVTRKDIHGKDLINGEFNRAVLGLAFVGGTCSQSNAAALAEDNELFAGMTIAHEIGHTWGMGHDGDGDSCPNGVNVMSASIPFGPGIFKWSSCSRQQFEQYLSYSHCLNDAPSGVSVRQINSGDYQLITPDEQCMTVLLDRQFTGMCNLTGINYPLEAICQQLPCFSEAFNNCSLLTSAAEGTACGLGKWCISGACVSSAGQFPTAIDGGWSTWTSYGQCSRTCGGGILTRERCCDNPKPQNGGIPCSGRNSEFELCNTQVCTTSQPDFAHEQCAATNDEPVDYGYSYSRLVYFTWVAHSTFPVTEDELCDFFCSNENYFLHIRGPYFKDGTRCSYDKRNELLKCVQGKCMEFGCDNKLDSDQRFDKCRVCGGDGSTCSPVTGSYNDGKLGVLTSVLDIPLGSTSIEITNAHPLDSHMALKTTSGQYLFGDGLTWPERGEYYINGIFVKFYVRNNIEEILIDGPTPVDFTVEVFQNTPSLKPIEYTYYNEYFPADRAVIWEYPPVTSTIPLYYDNNPQDIVVANANEKRHLNCTSYGSAPVTYIAWNTPSGRSMDSFISSDCAYLYDESQLSSQLSVTKYDTTKCVDLLFGIDWHLLQIQCTATNIVDLQGVDSVPVTMYLCVPCEVNLAIQATNSLGNIYDANNGSVISINPLGDARTLSCLNRGARGLHPDDDIPHLEILIKEAGKSNYVELTSVDGVELVHQTQVYDSEDAEYGKDKYRGLWKVRKDITLSTQSRFNLNGATLACVCRNKVHQRESEAWYHVTLRIPDAPLLDENVKMVQGYPINTEDVSNTEIILLNNGPFSTKSRRKKRRTMDALELACIARGTRSAVNILWRLDEVQVSDELIVVGIEDSVLNVGAGQQLVDTISTLTLYPVLRSYHTKNVSCEVASSLGSLFQRSSTLIVLSPPDTPLTLVGNDVVIEGQQITLECTAINGYPPGVFQWISEGSLIEDEQTQTETKILPNNRYQQSSTYSFRAKREINGKEITCALQQHYVEYEFTAETTATITISLSYCPNSDALLIGCPALPVRPRQSITLTCETDITNPASNIEWFINDIKQITSQPVTTTEVDYGYITTQFLTVDARELDGSVHVRCCQRSYINDTVCDDKCSDLCGVEFEVEGPPVQGCRWVRVRVTLENVNGESAKWLDAYDHQSSTEYRQLTSRLLSVFRIVYDGLTDYKGSVLPKIQRSPEGLIEVVIGIEFDYPYGSDPTTIHQTLIDSLDANGAIDVVTENDESVFDVLTNSLFEECVCPSDFCFRGASCSPNEQDFSSLCQCPGDYAPPRCQYLSATARPDHTTLRQSRGVTYTRLVFILEEIDDIPAVWDPTYDNPASSGAQEIIDGLETVITDVFNQRFICLRRVTVADLYKVYGRGIGIVAGLEFTHDCGNSLDAIRSVFIQSIDSDAKIDGSIYELDQDINPGIGLEEICDPVFVCSNGGICEPSLNEYSSSCRCPLPYTGPRCEELLLFQTTTRPVKLPENPKPSRRTGLTTVEFMIVTVSSILGGALLIGMILCIVCLYCGPSMRSNSNVHGDQHSDWPWKGQGRPTLTYNSGTFKRQFQGYYGRKEVSRGRGPHLITY